MMNPKLAGLLLPLTQGEMMNQQGRDFFAQTYGKKPEIVRMGIGSGLKNRFDSLPLLFNRNSRFAAVPLHYHDWIEINYMVSGKCIEVIDGNEIFLEEGKLTLIDTKTPHKIGYTHQEDLLVNFLVEKEFFTTNFLARLNPDHLVGKFIQGALDKTNNSMNYLVLDIGNNERLKSWMEELIYEFLRPDAQPVSIRELLFELILVEAGSSLQVEIDLQSVSSSGKALIRAIRHIEENYLTCTLESTAAHVGLNANYLSKLIKEGYDIGFKEMVTRLKLEKAVSLLTTTNETIDSIAESCGYHNLTFFYRLFKETYGCTPRQYRKQYRY